jgi:hypothetical protein
MLVTLDRYALHVHARGRGVTMPQGVLSVRDRTGLLGYDSREAVAGLVQMHVADPRLARVPLQVLDEGV